ncbi:hypothetical protein BCON_0126g00370 [Botryotinia convoluta]|uniref:Uncharacterized protein n=1 Tax=Botryotinia convoluta TaxID=54673 RepID=A0A4Z1I8P7_9HELO|nr:hypothetical protein BCON_0126g00370 [Botryotinia convoluta]
MRHFSSSLRSFQQGMLQVIAALSAWASVYEGEATCQARGEAFTIDAHEATFSHVLTTIWRCWPRIWKRCRVDLTYNQRPQK